MQKDRITLNMVENFLRKKHSQNRYEKLKEAGWPVDDKKECERLFHLFDQEDHIEHGGLFLPDTIRIKNNGDCTFFARTKNHCAIVRRVSPPLVALCEDQSGLDAGELRLIVSNDGCTFCPIFSGPLEKSKKKYLASWRERCLADPRGRWFDSFEAAKEKAIAMLRERRPGEEVFFD